MSIDYSVGCLVGYKIPFKEIYYTETITKTEYSCICNVEKTSFCSNCGKPLTTEKTERKEIIKCQPLFDAYCGDQKTNFDCLELEANNWLFGKILIKIDPKYENDNIHKIELVGKEKIDKLFDFDISKIPNAEFGIWFFNKSY